MNDPVLPDICIRDADSAWLQLSCTNAVRIVPGKRTVYRGNLGNTPVFIKHFFSTTAKSRHFAAELAGLQTLGQKEIPAPEVICSGYTDDGDPVIVTREISGGANLEVTWQNLADEVDKAELISRMLVLLAAHHEAGLQHTDPHFKNFYVTADNIFTLDGADIHATAKPLSKSDSVPNLALFLAQLLPVDDDRSLQLLSAYTAARGWPDTTVESVAVHELIQQKREWRRRYYVKKIFRRCSQIELVKKSGTEYLIERAFDSPKLREFLDNPDSEITKSTVLKNGNTSTVTQTRLDDQLLVVKRYNIKNAIHRLNRMLTLSRAERSWKNAHLLQFYGIPTANPVAIRVDKIGPFRGRAWFLACHIPGQTLTDCIASTKSKSAMHIDNRSFDDIVEQIARIMASLAQHQISHGDLKATNFLIDRGTVYLIDLDSMRQHTRRGAFHQAQRKDLARINENWLAQPEISRAFNEALASYGVGERLNK